MQSGLLNLKFGWMHENISCSHVVRFYTFGGWTLSNTGCSHIGRSSPLYLMATQKMGLIRTHSLKNQLQSRSQVSKISNLDRCSNKLAVVMQSGLEFLWSRLSQKLAVVMQSGLLNLKFGWMHENIGCSHVVRFYTFGGWTLSNTDCSHIGRSSPLYLTATQ